MEEVSHYKEAAFSIIENIKKNKNSPIEGGFKKVSLAALDYAYRVSFGSRLKDDKKQLIGNLLTLGATINDYYDVDLLETLVYKELRFEFKKLAPERESDFRRYRLELSNLEKHRPVPSQLHEEGKRRLEPIKRYREYVNRLSLAFSFAIAFDKPLANYYENFNNLTEEEQKIFKGFYNSVMAMQVVDDIVGRNGDVTKDRPSFYTAVCSTEEIKKQEVIPANKEAYRQLDNLFFEYYNQAAKNSSEKLSPIINAVRFTKAIYPKLTDLAKKYKFLETIAGLNILTLRDKKDL